MNDNKLEFQHSSEEIIIHDGIEIRFNQPSQLYLSSEYYFEKQNDDYLDFLIFQDLESSKVE